MNERVDEEIFPMTLCFKGFSPEHRKENIRRVGEICVLFSESGTIAIVSFISPYAADRNQVRKRYPCIRISFFSPFSF